VAAIEDDNPDADIEVTDHGSYVRVHASNHLRVTELTGKGVNPDDSVLKPFPVKVDENGMICVAPP